MKSKKVLGRRAYIGEPMTQSMEQNLSNVSTSSYTDASRMETLPKVKSKVAKKAPGSKLV